MIVNIAEGIVMTTHWLMYSDDLIPVAVRTLVCIAAILTAGMGATLILMWEQRTYSEGGPAVTNDVMPRVTLTLFRLRIWRG